ncbi:MAG: hypothetical protein IJ814_02450 [Paludibacteraceae bacterium]|nr:hypothetical protein [Paludibacteraceae bacterium]
MVKRIAGKIKWREVLTYALFVVLAALVWYGHAMQSARNTRVPVLVNYTDAPGTLAFSGNGLPDTIMVEIRDAGARLSAYHREPLRLTIDLRPYLHGEKGSVHITADALRRSISDLLQGTSRLIEIAPEEIICDYYTEQEKTVVLAVADDWRPAPEYQPVGKPVLSRTRAKIYGAAERLEPIDTIFTRPTARTDLMDTTTLRMALALPDNIRSNTDSVDVRIITERFTEKKMIIPILVDGVPEGYRIRIFPREVEVTVRVGISHFSQVTDEHVRAVCRYSPEMKEKLDVTLVYSNPYITTAWAYPGVVEFLLEQ